jgi:hypothetical protein
MFGLVASRFAQVQSGRRGRLYLLVLLFGVQLKNSWTIAEQAGDLSPDGTQRLLNFSAWDADQVRLDSRGYVLDRLDHPAGVVGGRGNRFPRKGQLLASAPAGRCASAPPR